MNVLYSDLLGPDEKVSKEPRKNCTLSTISAQNPTSRSKEDVGTSVEMEHGRGDIVGLRVPDARSITGRQGRVVLERAEGRTTLWPKCGELVVMSRPLPGELVEALSPAPQHLTAPADDKEHVWDPPAETATWLDREAAGTVVSP